MVNKLKFYELQHSVQLLNQVCSTNVGCHFGVVIILNVDLSGCVNWKWSLLIMETMQIVLQIFIIKNTRLMKDKSSVYADLKVV